jgi:hypothetical protein
MVQSTVSASARPPLRVAGRTATAGSLADQAMS